MIEYRINHEKTVERVAECLLPTEYGEFRLLAYRDSIENRLHFALQKGEVVADQPTLVRVHLRDVMSDVFGGLRKDFPLPIRKAMQAIVENGSGIVVVLSRPEVVDNLIRRIRQCHLQDLGGEIPEKEPLTDLRTYGVGAQILSDLGVVKMKVIGNPMRMLGIAGFGLEVVEHINIK